MNGIGEIAVLQHCADLVGESPLWDMDRDALWWVDIHGKALHRLDMSSGRCQTRELPFPPGALALGEDGDIIVAGGTGWYGFCPDTGELQELASFGDHSPAVRMNDGVVDPLGRFWVGTVPLKPSLQPEGRLFRLQSRAAIAVVDGLRTQNGTAISPDGRTFYLADSHREVCVIWAFDLEMESGSLSNRRVFHQPAVGRPDGAAVDADGCYWFAAIDAGRIVRLDPQGREMTHVPLPVSRPTNLAFFGPELSTLCVTSMCLGMEAGGPTKEPLAGALLSFDAGVRGLPQPRCHARSGVRRPKTDIFENC